MSLWFYTQVQGNSQLHPSFSVIAWYAEQCKYPGISNFLEKYANISVDYCLSD